MASDVLIRFRAESRQAQGEIQTLRGKLVQLNQTLAEQKNRLIGATAEEQKSIRAQMAKINALKASIRSQIEQANLQKQAIAQTQRETRERERAAQQQVRAARQMSAAQQALVQDLTIGARVIYQQLSRVTGSFVRAAADMETFRNTINVVTQDAEETNRILGDLLKLTVELVGIDTRDLISYAGRLMATGLSAEQAQTAISGVTKRVAEQGKTAFVTRRVLEQFTQAINANHISYHDFRPILRELPTLYRDATNALGVQIKSLEDFRRASEAVGGPTQAILLLLEEMHRVSEGANLDTLNAQLDILKDLSRVLGAELGEHLIPAIVAIVKQVNAWIESFINMDDSVQAAIAWVAALATALTGLVAVVGTATLGFGALSASLTALTGASGVAALTAGLGGLVAALAAAAPYIAIGGIIVGGIALLAKAINDTSASARVLRTEITRLDKVTQVYNLTTGQLETLTEAQANSYAKFQERVKTAKGEVQELSKRLRENREEQAKLNEAIEKLPLSETRLNLQQDLEKAKAAGEELTKSLETAQSTLAGLKFETPTDDAPRESLESLEEQIVRVVDQVIRLREAFREALSGDASTQFHDTVLAANALTAALRKELALQLKDADLTAKERLALELETGREILKIHQDIHAQIREQTSEFNSFWEFAARGAGDYATTIDIATTSVVDHAAELEALQNAGFFDGLDDPIKDYVAGLEATSVAADDALGVINRLGAGIGSGDADFRSAEERLRDFDEAFSLSEATIPRVTSEMRKFAGQVPPATQEVVEFRRELETLNRTGQEIDLSSVADALNIGADPLRGAQLSGRDAYTQYLKDNAINIGEELASTAIRTAGELRRIEQDRVESLADLEREYSEQIIAINEEKRQKLTAVEQEIEEERVRRLASIQQAFADAADAEVEARQKAADDILEIEQRASERREQLRERLNERLIDLEQRRDDRIQGLNDGFIEREQDRQREILAITERAAEARAEAEQAYANRVQAINNRLVEQVQDIQRGLQADIESLESGFVERQADRAGEIVQITQAAADDRAAANQTYVDTMEDIYNDLVSAWDALEDGFTERQADRAEERIEIEKRAADARVAANADYADTVARISTDLVDEVRRIESEIVDVQQEHAEERFAIEQESIEDRTEANAEYARRLAEIETERDSQLEESHRRLAEIQQEAADARLRADETYAERFQDIQNDLVDSVIDIQKDLNDTLNDLRDEQLEAEQERLDNLVELHEDTQQKLEDLERDRTQTEEDLREQYQRDRLDNAQQLDRDLQDAESEGDRERAIQRFNRREQDLIRDYHRDVLDLQKEQARAREELTRQTAAREVQIAQQAQRRLSEIEQQKTDARTQAQEGITAAESAAGVSFREAQENYVPALSAHEQALLTHAEALSRISAAEESDSASVNQRISEIIETSFTDAATAAMTLSESLAAVSTAEQERLSALAAETTGTVAGLNQQRTDAETRTGLSFEEALVNYTPAVDLNTQALNTLNETLTNIDAEERSGLEGLSVAEITDRETTTQAQQALETDAGISIEEARANFVPALSSAAQATLTLNATMRELDTSFREAVAEIQESGLVDRQRVDEAILTRIAEATAQQAALETQAGTTFAEASLAFQPGLSDIAQAGVDRDTALSDINQTETEGIEGINAQSIADRLETDAAITEARDTYIKARDTEIFRHNTAILQLNQAEADDIRSVRATLSKNLESIDEKLDVELAEIRETKIVFDTRMNELITTINEQGNLDVAALKEDTAAMRVELEAIAEEERNNAWKGAILKIASTGITIAGVAAGAALGGPAGAALGGQIGAAVGGLVEQGGNELFHYPQTDRIARNIARQSVLRQSRPTPNYLPDANQIRNARDVSREIVRGISEGLDIGNRRDGGLGDVSSQAGFPEEISATIEIQFPDGTVQELRDQMVRLNQQDR